MSESAKEYEVESIVEAKVGYEGKKRRRLVWKYRVRWKGYSESEDTWEPADNFTGTDTIENFWRKADTDGRDIKDMSLFKTGEHFLPIGPPQQQKSATSPAEEPSENGKQSLGKRPLAEPDATVSGQRSAKRQRGTRQSTSPDPKVVEKRPPSQRRKSNTTAVPGPSISASATQPKKVHRRSPSSEIIPASDDDDAELTYTPMDTTPDQLVAPSAMASQAEQTVLAHNVARALRSRGQPGSPIKSASTSTIPPTPPPPLKRIKTRKASPPADPSPSTSAGRRRSKPGPGRSSAGLLKLDPPAPTLAPARKKRQSTKATAVTEGALPLIEPKKAASVEATPSPAEELPALQQHEVVKDKTPEPTAEEKEQRNRIFSAAAHLFPDLSASPVRLPVLEFGSLKLPTIFGPLSYANGTGSAPHTLTEQPASTWRLNLDTTTSVPIEFMGTKGGAKRLNVQPVSKGTPGKFYKAPGATTLLKCLKPTGEYGIAELGPRSSADEKEYFERFNMRLQDGDIFVEVSGSDILAFCSATNTSLAQALKTPAELLNRSGTVVATKVDIQDYSGYADAALEADFGPWDPLSRNDTL